MSDEHEYLDDTPVAIPVKYTRPPTKFEEIQRLVRATAFQEALRQQGVETFEEADDFDVPDDPPDPLTRWELNYEAAQVYPADYKPPQPEAPPEPIKVVITNPTPPERADGPEAQTST